MLLSLRAHYHLQGGASFYRDSVGYRVLGPPGQYWTGDRELSPMGNYLLGGKLAFFRRPQQERSSWFVEMELGAKYELLLYRPESPVRPQRRPHVRAHRPGRVRDAILIRWEPWEGSQTLPR